MSAPDGPSVRAPGGPGAPDGPGVRAPGGPGVRAPGGPSARAALLAGGRELWRWPALTLLVVLAAMVAALAVRAAAGRARQLWHLAPGDLARGRERLFRLAR